MAPLTSGCVPINNATDCKVVVYNSPYDYILPQSSVRGGNVDNTRVDISIYGSYFTSSNIVQGLIDVNNFITNNQNYMCTGNGVLGGNSSKLDPLGNLTSVSSQMRNSIMSISCGSALFSDTTNAAKKSRMDALTNFRENTLKKYSNQVFGMSPCMIFLKMTGKKGTGEV